MSTTKPAMSHLTQPKLSADDLKILAARADWLSKAKFEKINADNFELCVDDGLPGIWTLLKGMDLVQKFPIRRWSIIRIPGPKSSPFFSSEGSAFICPIGVIQGKPTISGLPLVVGETTYITKGVNITPTLDLLFLLL